MQLCLDGCLAAVSRPAIASLRARSSTGSCTHFIIRDFLLSSPLPSPFPLHQNLNPRDLQLNSIFDSNSSFTQLIVQVACHVYLLLIHFTSSSHFFTMSSFGHAKSASSSSSASAPTPSRPRSKKSQQAWTHTHQLPTAEQRSLNGRKKDRNLISWTRKYSKLIDSLP